MLAGGHLSSVEISWAPTCSPLEAEYLVNKGRAWEDVALRSFAQRRRFARGLADEAITSMKRECPSRDM